MRPRLTALAAHYGAGPLHLLVMAASLALGAYTVLVLGISALWDTDVWWQSILVWFAGAVIVHDFVLFPLYALADRCSIRILAARRSSTPVPHVSPLNYIRVPVLATALLFLVFFPGIVQQGSSSYVAATGQTQEPFLGRWLLLTACFFAASALTYGGRLAISRQRPDRAGAGGSGSERQPTS